MDNTFIRKDFYIQPPAKDATPAEWAEWMKRDDRKAAAHKAQVTKSLEHADTPDDLQESNMRKVGGVWKQVLAIGISGGDEDNGYTAEPMVQDQQETHIALVNMEQHRNKRGGNNRKGRNARKRANRKKAVKKW